MATVFIRTTIMFLFLTFTMRIMGKRQVGELEISELVVTFMLSELATIPLSDTEVPLFYAVIPILLLLSLEGILSFLTIKIPIFKKILYGKPTILINRGILDQKELANQRIELSELLCAIRQNGVSKIEDVYFAILEENGKLSVFPKNEASPVTPAQLKLQFDDDGVSLPIIMDRRIIKENLQLCGWSQIKLAKELKKRQLSTEDVFLFSIDCSGHVYIIEKEKKQ